MRGCDPKKILVGASSVADEVRRRQGKGIVGVSHIDWTALMAFKREFTDPVPRRQEESYAEKGIVSFHGQARFTGRNRVKIEEVQLEARYILIATGAKPVTLGIPGEEYLITSEEFLSLGTLPKRMVIVGGGYIAAEFSNIAVHAGSQVKVIQRGDRMLKQFDPDLVGWLMEKFHAMGIDVRTRTKVERVEKTSVGYCVIASSGEQSVNIETDAVVHGAGRVPNLDGLDLDRAGIDAINGRLQLNEYLQSISNPAIYAAGDAALSGPPLTPVSSHDGKIVAKNLLEGNRHKPDYRGVPSVTFTDPPIAAVGLSESVARQQGIDFRMQSQKAADWYSARQAAEPVYGFKLLVDKSTDRILGAHLVGPHADEIINLFALAIRHELTAEALKQTMFAYPTAASDIAYML